VRPIHPVTVWRGRLSVALDALETTAGGAAGGAATRLPQPIFTRRRPVETAAVQLPTGDRLQIPTCAETLRLKGYLILSRNSRRDYTEFAELVDALEPETAAVPLIGIDKYYAGQSADRNWIATQLVRRLADPHPADVDNHNSAGAGWARVQQRCLSVAVAMLSIEDGAT
jgi:RND superfamily putative drug exporter